MNFCHLHVHNEFSYLDGYGTAKAYSKQAKALGMNHLALTNHGNIDGAIKFQEACKKEGTIPIHGCEFYIVPDEHQKLKGEQRGHITALVHNDEGWNNLCKMLTIANLDGFYYKPRIGYKNFLAHCEGLVVLTGCSSSFLVKHTPGQMDEFLDSLYQKLGENLYLEVQPHLIPEQKELNALCASLVSQTPELKLVATNDCHYILAEDAEAQEVLLAIQTKAKWSDKDRFRFSITGMHLRSEEEMADAFVEQGILTDDQINQALDATMEIAEKCQFQIKKKKISLPKLPGKEQLDPGQFIWAVAEKKLLALSKDWSTEKTNQYFDRLSEEWKIINEKNFAQYFMIVHELVEWCRNNQIMVGPGRGSAGGSLLAYLLGITTCMDPIEYGLLFSRFIAEDRIDFPDIDLDFQDDKRYLVREHLEALYGKDHISSLSTFATMKGRGCIRDVCRVFDVPLHEVDILAKSVVENPDSEESAAWEAFETEIGQRFKKKYPKICEYILKLEGQIRQAGQHAAAIIVSNDNLRDGTRGSLVVRSEEIVSNWDMQDSEYIGLMKLDILALNMLTVLSETRRLILLKEEVKKFEFDKVPLNDDRVYQSFYEGKTNGVFQLSTWATTNLAKQIRATNILEIADIIALVRPGPFNSGMTKDYIERKMGKAKWIPKHPIYEEITENTFGVIVYQEQVMEVIHKVAGLPYVTADKIRKVIGKKRDAKEFKPYEDAFVQGCANMKTLSKKEAQEFWVGLQKHAQYSFNKSHSVAYAIIGYWCGWCRVNFPAEFLCASLTYGSEGKKEEILTEALEMGLQVVPPKIGVSDATIWVIKSNSLYIPFVEIKGVGEKTAQQCGNMKATPAPVQQGFFWPGQSNNTIMRSSAGSKKIDELLKSDSLEYKSFKLPQREEETYPKLKSFFPAYDGNKDWHSLNFTSLTKESPVIYEKSYVPKKTLSRCSECALRQECSAPVPSSPGYFNAAIIGEGPGENEDKEHRGFVGRAGKVLWDELFKYDLTRDDFHIGNVVKCWPAQSKTPNADQIKICSEKWLYPELKEINCRLLLAFGNTGLQAFSRKKAGITQLKENEMTQWNESIGAWVCYCLHPAAVLRQDNANNRLLFEMGIKNFINKIQLLQ